MWQGYPEYRHRETGIVMVKVPGGTFLMGSPGNYLERIDERPQHQVTLSSFLIAKCEVSQREWEQVMGTNPSLYKGQESPVERVSWEDCQSFCQKTGLTLPTEALWEYACRAETTTPFAFGTTITTEQVNLQRQKPLPVEAFAPNGYGIHNMHGNVWEWCQDVFDSQFYSKPEATQFNPLCESGSEQRILRGGSMFSGASHCRSAGRASGDPARASGIDPLGLRPAFYPLP